MEYIHSGWSLIADEDRILFHDSGKEGDKKDYYTYDGILKKVNEKEYFQKKYGNACEKIWTVYGNSMTSSIFDFDSNIYVNYYQDGLIRKFDNVGNLIMEYEDNFDTIYDIEVQGNSIWVAYPTANTIKKYALDNYEEEITLGERSDESIFCLPESIVIYGDYLYICDMGNCRIRKVDLGNLDIYDFMTFDEPVWEYVRTKEYEFVRLQSGIYSVKSSIG